MRDLLLVPAGADPGGCGECIPPPAIFKHVFVENSFSIVSNLFDNNKGRFTQYSFLRVFTRYDAMPLTQRFLIYTVSVNAFFFFANARQNAPSIFVRFRVEPSSIFATNYVRQLRN